MGTLMHTASATLPSLYVCKDDIYRGCKTNREGDHISSPSSFSKILRLEVFCSRHGCVLVGVCGNLESDLVTKALIGPYLLPT